MLTGYLLLLREASHADAERAQRQAEAAAHARERAARAKARERARAAQRSTPAEGTPMDAAAVEETTAAAALAAKFAAAPVPADYEDSGRDFAPGLAGKYTTSNADPEPAADDYVYEVPRLRAVGD
jgi:nucleoid-associated protein YgaU